MQIIYAVIIFMKCDDFTYITIMGRGAANYLANCLIV